jgi:hypothetical protein
MLAEHTQHADLHRCPAAATGKHENNGTITHQ